MDPFGFTQTPDLFLELHPFSDKVVVLKKWLVSSQKVVNVDVQSYDR